MSASESLIRWNTATSDSVSSVLPDGSFLTTMMLHRRADMKALADKSLRSFNDSSRTHLTKS